MSLVGCKTNRALVCTTDLESYFMKFWYVFQAATGSKVMKSGRHIDKVSVFVDFCIHFLLNMYC
jgi:hypothetical protein